MIGHLVDLEDGCQLWPERFDGELHDVFAVQVVLGGSYVQRHVSRSDR